MKETSADRDQGGGPAVCKTVAGGVGDVDGKGGVSARRRRRLELRRLGKVAEGPAVAAKRIRSCSDRSSSPDSSLETAAAGCWPARLSHGAVSVIGRRREMEDAFAVALSFLASDPSSPGAKEREQEQDFFAVYDGHGGARVAEACRERMHVVLAEEVGLRRGGVGSDDDLRWEEAMAACFARVDGEVTGGLSPPPKPPLQQQADDGDDVGAINLPYRTVGSTAVVAVVSQRRIVVANCGDSRAVLSRGGVAVPLSTDHK